MCVVEQCTTMRGISGLPSSATLPVLGKLVSHSTGVADRTLLAMALQIPGYP